MVGEVGKDESPADTSEVLRGGGPSEGAEEDGATPPETCDPDGHNPGPGVPEDPDRHFSVPVTPPR